MLSLMILVCTMRIFFIPLQFYIKILPGKRVVHYTFDLKCGDYKKMNKDLLNFSESHNTPLIILVKIFQEEKGGMYVNEIHLNDRGNKILIDSMVSSIERKWKLRKR